MRGGKTRAINYLKRVSMIFLHKHHILIPITILQQNFCLKDHILCMARRWPEYFLFIMLSKLLFLWNRISTFIKNKDSSNNCYHTLILISMSRKNSFIKSCLWNLKIHVYYGGMVQRILSFNAQKARYYKNTN